MPIPVITSRSGKNPWRDLPPTTLRVQKMRVLCDEPGHFGLNRRPEKLARPTLAVMSRQVVAGNPRYWGFAIESEMGAVVVVMIQEWREGISALI